MLKVEKVICLLDMFFHPKELIGFDPYLTGDSLKLVA